MEPGLHGLLGQTGVFDNARNGYFPAVVSIDNVAHSSSRPAWIAALASGAMVIGTAMNLASPSHLEQALWTPVAATLAAVL